MVQHLDIAADVADAPGSHIELVGCCFGPDKEQSDRAGSLPVEGVHSCLAVARHKLAEVGAIHIHLVAGDKAIAGHEEGTVVLAVHIQELDFQQVDHTEELGGLEGDILVGRSHLGCTDRRVRS